MPHGPHTARPKGEKVFRGSKKCVARIKWRGNTSPGFWVFLILLVVLLTVVVPWMMKHSEEWHDHGQRPSNKPIAMPKP